MQTIVKCFISLLFALVIGILPSPANRTFAVTATEAIRPIPVTGPVRCGMVLPEAIIRDTAVASDC